MVPLLTLAMLLSATLVFAVQPLFFRLVVPLLGGAGAVWITCMAFFQAALLAGYGYVAAVGRLRPTVQVAVHLGLLGLVLLALPLALPAGVAPRPGDPPALWLLSVCATTVGLPFMAVCTTAPLLQRWFAWTPHPAAKDPYFLYAASNVGSLLGLLGYPLLVEPWLPLARQGRLWSYGYGLLLVLIAVCAVAVLRARGARPSAGDPRPAVAPPEVEAVAGAAPGRPWHWVLLAFVPTSLMLGVTTHLTTDVAAVPLLGVMPLALYLVTFVIAFQRRPWIPAAVALRLQPQMLLPLVAVQFVGQGVMLGVVAALHLGAFFLSALVCHGELVRRRPDPSRLASFYLWISFGGVLGGLFNALVAPLVFSTVLEYPLVLVLACLLRPVPRVAAVESAAAGFRRPRSLDLLLPLGLLLVLLLLSPLLSLLPADLKTVGPLVLLVPAGLACLSFSGRPLRLGLGVAVMLLVGARAGGQRPLHVERSFYGVHRVVLDDAGTHLLLRHGSTAHGALRLGGRHDPEPLAYYHREGPLGQLMSARPAGGPPWRVAVVGLGTGSIAAYGRPGDSFTFYEIDPAVERVARRYFTFLEKSRASVRVVLGDARPRLREAPGAAYDLIVLDAFSSDAVPVHLLTREALAVYLAKLAPGGRLAFHISNRYLSLGRVIAGLAGDAGLVALERQDRQVSPRRLRAHRYAADWAVLARGTEELGALARDPRWQPLAGPGRPASGPRPVLWTDDFSDILRLLLPEGLGGG